MMKTLIRFLPVVVALGFLSAGCASSRVVEIRQPPTEQFPDGEVVVTELPPQPQREYFNNAANEEHVWVAGYWSEMSGHWVWIPGHWE